ncbi:fatty acyl-CoA synthetase [Neptunomonas sp.]|uniref:fatty acyl-CoA synthetase n=1 Tax=Neptunomonas sp. TaxID=1971898 RepID=UPI003565DD71
MLQQSATIEYATRNCIGDALARTVLRQENKEALVFSGRHWTYRQLDEAVNRIANQLLQEGLQPGNRVAAYGKNSDAYVLLWLACSRSGLIHVPVNYALVQEELSYILTQSGARAVFCDDALINNIESLQGKINADIIGSLCSETTGFQRLDILAIAYSDASTALPPIEQTENDVVQLLYTSGTTSDPKGAMHTHRSLLSEYSSCLLHLDIKEEDRVLAGLPLYHSAQMHMVVMPSLLVGSHIHLIESPVVEQVLALMEAHRINSFFAPPTVWISLLRHPDFDKRDISGLKKLYYGASIMPEPIVAELAERLPNCGLYNCYGQSEIAPLATVLSPEEHLRYPASAGKPIFNVQTRIVDPVTMEECLPCQQGEIVHRSPQLMVGYWDKPAETEEAFAGGWFHSGDLAYQNEEGYLFIVDRIKDVVNTGGVLVASRDVEDALYGHPAVAEVAVIGLPHEKWIEAITAVVTLKPGCETDETELIRHAQAHLAAFKVPKAIHFVETLPKNTAGKLLKRSLRKTFG